MLAFGEIPRGTLVKGELSSSFRPERGFLYLNTKTSRRANDQIWASIGLSVKGYAIVHNCQVNNPNLCPNLLSVTIPDYNQGDSANLFSIRSHSLKEKTNML